MLLEREKDEKGEIVDGLKAIEAAIAMIPREDPALLAAGGKQKKGVATRMR